MTIPARSLRLMPQSRPCPPRSPLCGADFDHQNAREPRPGQIVGNILTNGRPEGIPVVLEITTNEGD